MASGDLQNTILQYFQSVSDQTVSTNSLVSKLRCPRKSINQGLYSLSRRGLLSKVQNAPPLWRLKSRMASPSVSRVPCVVRPSLPPVIDMRSIEDGGNMCQKPRELAASILHRLRLSPQPLAAIVLAKTISCEESTIQHLLDQLLRHDIVTNVGYQPVKWILKNDPGNSLPELELTNLRGSPPTKIPHTEESADVCQARDRYRKIGVSDNGSENQRNINEREARPLGKLSTCTYGGSCSQEVSCQRPLPPHLLLQQREEVMSNPAIDRTGISIFEAPHRPITRGLGRGRPNYERPSQEHFLERNVWKPPTFEVTSNVSKVDEADARLRLAPLQLCHVETVKSEPSESGCSTSVSKCPAIFSDAETERIVSNLVRPVKGVLTRSSTSSSTKTSNIPPSPMALVHAERQSSGATDSELLTAQANLLGALAPKQSYLPASVAVSEEYRPVRSNRSSIPSDPLGLRVKDLTGAKLIMNSEIFEALNRNPISVLTEYAQSRKTSIEIRLIDRRGPPNRPKFTMAAVVGNRQFPKIVASNKKDGRKEAADSALRLLMAEGLFNTPDTSPRTDVSNISKTGTHFDKIASQSHQAFNLLAAAVSENLSGRKVLAALIMKLDAEDEGSVICLGTGNRCITGPEMSLEGHTVNDCHAEVITRRSFVRFLYKQLCMYQPDADHKLFERAESGKLRIKACVTFHLYISTAPCGDGALFSPRDAADSKLSERDNRADHEPTFTNNLQGILRTKIEGGEGTIPIELGCHNQTWDGILRGERLRTMSCSDKVCRWNVLGMQGALLANFIEPVYMSTLTLGCLYDHGHLARAVCCRLERNADQLPLPNGYMINHPHLGRVTSYEPQRGTDKTKSISMNWCAGDSNVELVDGTLGQVMNRSRSDVISRIAKKHLFAAYHVLKSRLKPELPDGDQYKQAKENAITFQEAKKVMFARFKKSKFGNWVQKPIEEKMFTYNAEQD